MKRLIALLLLASLTIQADPIVMWDWTPATTYENGLPKDTDDIWLTTLHCNDIPDVQGQPYEIEMSLDDPNAPPLMLDMAPVVQFSGMGEYWCAATHFSQKYAEQSRFSGEKSFTATAQNTGFVPNPPTLL